MHEYLVSRPLHVSHKKASCNKKSAFETWLSRVRGVSDTIRHSHLLEHLIQANSLPTLPIQCPRRIWA
jgi:hypothetical protein